MKSLHWFLVIVDQPGNLLSTGDNERDGDGDDDDDTFYHNHVA
jgi:hypothetical protein